MSRSVMMPTAVWRSAGAKVRITAPTWLSYMRRAASDSDAWALAVLSMSPAEPLATCARAMRKRGVMTSDPLVLNESCDVAEALERMSRKAVRRAPIVDDGGELVGIVTFDDLLPVLAGQIAAIGAFISQQTEPRRSP